MGRKGSRYTGLQVLSTSRVQPALAAIGDLAERLADGQRPAAGRLSDAVAAGSSARGLIAVGLADGQTEFPVLGRAWGESETAQSADALRSPGEGRAQGGRGEKRWARSGGGPSSVVGAGDGALLGLFSLEPCEIVGKGFKHATAVF
jgi:hypothetical protein